jgi:hypothetical protein
MLYILAPRATQPRGREGRISARAISGVPAAACLRPGTTPRAPRARSPSPTSPQAARISPRPQKTRNDVRAHVWGCVARSNLISLMFCSMTGVWSVIT